MGEAPVTPIAVIGMGCRLPGGIDSPDKLWEALLRGDDLVTEIPADRWDVDEFYDPEPGVPGKSVTRYGGFLDDIWGSTPRSSVWDARGDLHGPEPPVVDGDLMGGHRACRHGSALAVRVQDGRLHGDRPR